MKKRFLSLCLVLTLALAGCAGAADPAVPSQEAPQPPPSEAEEPQEVAYDFKDLAGNPVVPWSEEVQGIVLSYTLGWTPQGEGYVKLQRDTVLGSFTVLEASSQYFPMPRKNHPTKLICDQSSYAFSGEKAVPGVLQIDQNAVLFFPYENAETPFFFLQPRSKETEKAVQSWDTALEYDGASGKIQPFGVQFDQENRDRILGQLSLEEAADRHWYDAEIRFSSLSAYGLSYSMGEEVSATRVYGFLDDDSLHVKKEITLSKTLGKDFLYWIFPEK